MLMMLRREREREKDLRNGRYGGGHGDDGGSGVGDGAASAPSSSSSASRSAMAHVVTVVAAGCRPDRQTIDLVFYWGSGWINARVEQPWPCSCGLGGLEDPALNEESLVASHPATYKNTALFVSKLLF